MIVLFDMKINKLAPQVSNPRSATGVQKRTQLLFCYTT